MIPNNQQQKTLEILRKKSLRLPKTFFMQESVKQNDHYHSPSFLKKDLAASKKQFPLLSEERMQKLSKQIQEKMDDIKQGKADDADLIRLKRDIAEEYFKSEELIENLSDIYIKKATYNKSKNSDDVCPQIHVIGGPPGSGKSTIIKDISKKENNLDLVAVDPDELVTYHPQFSQIKDLFGDQWGEATTVINRPARKKIIDGLCEQKYNICIEGSKTFADYAEQAMKKGYKATIHLPLVPPLISQQRSVKRIADQINKGEPPRGIKKEEYSNLDNGHHIAGLRAVINLFKNQTLFPENKDAISNTEKATTLVLHTTHNNGLKQDIKIDSIEAFFDVYGKLINKDIPKDKSKDLQRTISSSSQSLAEEDIKDIDALVNDDKNFSRLNREEERRQIDRISGTLQSLLLAGADLESPQIQPFLKTIGIDLTNDNQKTIAYKRIIPELVGKHHDIERTEEDFKRVSSILGVPYNEKSWRNYAKKYGYKLPS